MFRFFIDESNIIDDNFIEIVEKEDFHHGKNVLRLKVGEKLELISEANKYINEITEIKSDSILTKILEKTELKNKDVSIKLYQGMPKSDKFELIIQKSVELGVDEIVPFESERTIVKFKAKSYNKKQERYEKIIKAAAMQSKRNSIPKIDFPINLNEIELEDGELGILAYEESYLPIREVLKNLNEYNKISIVIGPEGGFSKNEVDNLVSKGFNSVLLGERILRTETASLNLLSIIGYELER
ncbi:RsmE family RNA methyltransferase [Mediannikoviicoccus vaginalis]|uniref:RsmE family RNA methyltransferase n=1 Tax=Mediannikoviicoccus vaginalis TaxID=2899727 RepID=UPI001F37BF25|nr:RsmE family RNA methyltransferase [Mediannikoviicoccus vaginalis]